MNPCMCECHRTNAIHVYPCCAFSGIQGDNTEIVELLEMFKDVKTIPSKENES